METKPLVVQELRKSFGKVKALKGVSFALNRGEIFGLIGPDGAGKTTLMRIVVSLLKPGSGEVFFKGKEVRKHMKVVRANIGYMPQRFSLYPDLTVEENLRFFGDLFGVERAVQEKRLERLYGFSRLGPFKKRRAAALSGGMKQKLALSCMLMHEPQVMVMDEPTYGVDPVSRAELWEILRTLADEGRSILVSTAYMDEALLCDRIALIFDGKILAQGPSGDILKDFSVPLFRIITENLHQTYNRLLEKFSPGDCHLFGDGIHLADRQKMGRDGILAILQELDLQAQEIVPIPASIEDVFLDLIAREAALNERDEV